MTNPFIGRDAAQISYDDISGQTITDPTYGSLNGYTVEQTFGSTGSGVTAFALRNPAGQIVIAFRGTNDATDVADDIGNLGWRQWEEVRSDVNNYINNNWTGGDITFAGHSLGGALAQYAAYEVAAQNPLATSNLNVYTFNALGALNGINENVAGGFNSSVLNGISASHYFNPEDLVSRLGGGHVGGQSIEIPDARIGPDGGGTAHFVAQFVDSALNAGVVGTPNYYNNPLSQQSPEIFSEFISALFNATAVSPPSLEDMNRLADAIRAIPIGESLETARLLIDTGGALAAEFNNLVIDAGLAVANAAIDVARAVVDRAIATTAAIIDFGIDVVGYVIDGTVRALIAVGEAGVSLINYLGEALDRTLQILGGAAESFADAIRDQLVRLIDPIVLDLDGNGIELVGRADSGVYFDMDGDGVRELTGWVSPTDGLLAIDGNGNGTIDNIDELIGDQGQSGFSELAGYDLNNDNVINANDAVWADLRVWVDANSNGITDAGELMTMGALNIRSIDLNYTEVNFTAAGNQIHEQSVFEFTNGTTGLAADIWFDVDNVANGSQIGLTGNLTVDDLPDIRGRGDVESLRSAMLNDGALATLVAGFVGQTAGQLGNARAQVEQIIFRWAGVQSVDPESRGGLFDGQQLAALEAFLGTSFAVSGAADPNAQAVASLTASWNGLVDGIVARLVMSGPVGDAMSGNAVFVPEIDRLLTVQTPEELLASFAASAPVEAQAAAGYWAAILPAARQIITDAGGTVTGSEYANAERVALENAGLGAFTNLLSAGITNVAAGTGIITEQGLYNLTSGADTLYVVGGMSAVYGGAGHDQIAVAGNSSNPVLLSGGIGNDLLYGGSGDDFLDGGAGDDTMAGGGGNDTYVVQDAGDVLLEIASAGTDTVRSYLSFTLAQNFENLTLLGANAVTGIGNSANNYLIGSGVGNWLEGQDGNDTLDGAGGSDTMLGGTGNDTYYVNSSGDRIVETGSDTDHVISSISYSLGARLENLTLVGSALNGFGNASNNQLVGNDLGNILHGGAGSDSMYGGLGDDSYFVDSTGDRVYENANAGIDTVRSSVGFTLGNNVEHLILTGDYDISGTGNSLNNRITGNSGNNFIDGGAGDDTMIGGAGDDGYVVNSAGDVIIEGANTGTDTVYTELASYTLGNTLENLRLYVYNDTDARNGTGNARANQITGNNGANLLIGLQGDDTLYGLYGDDTLLGREDNDYLDGGNGADRMQGGAGDDIYVVDNAADLVLELNGEGTDLVWSSVSYSLGGFLENLTLFGNSSIDGQGNALANILTGNRYNNVLEGRAGADTMIGGDGNDTYIVQDTTDVLVEAAGEGFDSVHSYFSFTLAENFEYLTLLGANALNGTGNAANNYLLGSGVGNVLRGLEGNDTLDGGGGNDTMIGGLGADTYYVNATGDRIFETGSDLDSVFASASYALGLRLENLTLTGNALNAFGNSLSNRLTGNDLANILHGGAGRDTMYGGDGDDSYYVDNTGDYVYEYSNGGTDTVRSSVTFDLGSYVEHLILTGTLDLNGYGNSLDNRITGNGGDNYIDGEGGNDTMIGGAGNDIYIVDSAGDVIIEGANTGIDSVRTELAQYTLGNTLENLRLYVSNDTNARNGTGNARNNEIIGNNGVNLLIGLQGDDTLFGLAGDDTLLGREDDDFLDGGTGADRMQGGIGNDIYVVDNVGDFALELSGEGTDEVRSSISYILNGHIENLTLTGTGNIDAQGNNLDNVINGNSRNNNIDGGTGADTMLGGAGNDVYTVDSLNDVVLEVPGAGIDEVRSSVSYTLGFAIENLRLLGSFNLRATGNAEDNVIIGNVGNNRIVGSYGEDTMTGGAGSDWFEFLSTDESGIQTYTADRITDFSTAQGDRLAVSAIDAIEGTAANDAFTFIGNAGFSAAGQIRSYMSGGVTYVQFNTDDNLNDIEMVLALTNGVAISASDFIL